MKKILVTMVIALLLLVGCTSKEEANTVNHKFINDVEKALEEKDKWNKSIENSDEYSGDNMAAYYEEETLFETNLYQYFNKDFEDAELQAIAKQYIEAVKEKEAAVQYFESDNDKFWDEYLDGASKREIALKHLVNNSQYGLTSNAYDAKVARLENYTDQILSNLTLEKKSKTAYSIEIKNSTGVDWENFYTELNLVDIDGEEVEPLEAIEGLSIPSGKSVTLSFETDNTDVIGVVCDNYRGEAVDKKERFFLSTDFE